MCSNMTQWSSKCLQYATQGDLAPFFPTFANLILNLDFFVKTPPGPRVNIIRLFAEANFKILFFFAFFFIFKLVTFLQILKLVHNSTIVFEIFETHAYLEAS